MAKVRPGEDARKELDEAMDGVADALTRWAKEHGEQRPPEYVLLAIRDLAEARRDDDDESPAMNARAAREAGLSMDGETSHSLNRGRHDEKRVRGNRAYAAGMLLPEGAPQAMRPQTDRVRTTLRSLIDMLTRWRFSERWLLDSEVSRLEAARVALLGPEPTWEDELTKHLEWDEHHREEARLREVHMHEEPAGTYFLGDRLAPDPNAGASVQSASGVQILRAIQARGLDTPAELTAAAIDAMREQSGTGGGGPGAGAKRKPKNIVGDFSKKLAKKARGNSRK